MLILVICDLDYNDSFPFLKVMFSNLIIFLSRKFNFENNLDSQNAWFFLNFLFLFKILDDLRFTFTSKACSALTRLQTLHRKTSHPTITPVSHYPSHSPMFTFRSTTRSFSWSACLFDSSTVAVLSPASIIWTTRTTHFHLHLDRFKVKTICVVFFFQVTNSFRTILF